MKSKKKLISGVLALLMMGCSTAQPVHQTIKMNCNIPDTIVKVNGDRHDCPGEVKVRRDSKVTIEAYKDGYDKYSKIIDYHLSDTAKLDAVGTVFFFFPVFGLLSPGAWDLDETEVNIILNQMKKEN